MSNISKKTNFERTIPNGRSVSKTIDVLVPETFDLLTGNGNWALTAGEPEYQPQYMRVLRVVINPKRPPIDRGVIFSGSLAWTAFVAEV